MGNFQKVGEITSTRNNRRAKVSTKLDPGENGEELLWVLKKVFNRISKREKSYRRALCVCVVLVAQSYGSSLLPTDPPDFSVREILLGRNTRVDCHSLLQR